MKSKISIYCLLLFVSFQSCKTKQIYSSQSNPFELKSEIIVSEILELDSRYIIYPTAFIKTIGKGKLVIKEPICILGKSQVFDTDINIDYRPFSISEIYPEWFGAKGYDQLDDTKAFKKVLTIGKEYYNSINIIISLGYFKISEQLVISSEVKKMKSINFIGHSMSTSSQHGSSIVWFGKKGESMILINNVNLSKIENIDFHGFDYVKNNLEFRPTVNQVVIKNCTFKGCKGEGSTNINLNKGNNIQVSEIQIENCTFHGVPDNRGFYLTESAISGGLANTKNFYIKNCSFLGYNVAAIDILHNDAMVIENNTFAFNDVDIRCMLCNSYIKSNYSERSKAFFESTSSSNLSFTTMIGNFFDGDPKDGYIIRDGAGCLYMVNNNFGGSGEENDINKIKWESRPLNPIFSFGNFYNNIGQNQSPFYNRSNQIKKDDIISNGDIGGKNADKKVKIIIEK
jgi:hypothetical protein